LARISISSMFLWDLNPQEMAATLTEAGLEEIEFWAETPWYWEGGRREDQLKDIKSVLGKFCTTVHAPVMDLNPSSYNDLVHLATIKESLRTINLAKFLGAKVMTIHPGKRTAKRPVRQVELDKFRKYLEVCLDCALEMGVPLALENLEPALWSMCTTPEEMAPILDEYPIGLTLDISHAIPPLSLALSFVETFSDLILNVHVSATHENMRHLPPSDGSVDEVLTALKDVGYKGPLTLELDDKKFPETLSREDKAGVLIEEKRHLEAVWK